MALQIPRWQDQLQARAANVGNNPSQSQENDNGFNWGWPLAFGGLALVGYPLIKNWITKNRINQNVNWAKGFVNEQYNKFKQGTQAVGKALYPFAKPYAQPLIQPWEDAAKSKRVGKTIVDGGKKVLDNTKKLFKGNQPAPPTPGTDNANPPKAQV